MSEKNSFDEQEKIDDWILNHVRMIFNDYRYEVGAKGQPVPENIKGKAPIQKFYSKDKNYIYYIYHAGYLGEWSGVVGNIISGKSDLQDSEEGFVGEESGLTIQNRDMYLAEKELWREGDEGKKIIRIGYCTGGHKVMAIALTQALLDKNFDSEKNEIILINSFGLSDKSVDYFMEKLGQEKFDAITSRVVNINCVEDYISPINKNHFGKTFYFDVKDKPNLGLHDKHEVRNLNLDKQVQINRGHLFWKYFWESVERSCRLLGQDKSHKVLRALFMIVDKVVSACGQEKITSDIYGNKLKIQPFKAAIAFTIFAKSYISAYFRSLSTGRRVLFGFGILSSVVAITVACANILGIGFLLAFPPAALIATAVTLGCVGLVSMISSFVGINWREPVEESKAETKQIGENEVNEQEKEKEEKDINEQNIGNVHMESSVVESKDNVTTYKNETFIEQKTKGINNDNSVSPALEREQDVKELDPDVSTTKQINI